MAAKRLPEPLGPGGAALWRSITDEYDLEEHERALLIQACRIRDVLDRLNGEIRASESVVGAKKVLPAMVESRQQSLVLARLLSALRLPAGEEGDQQKSARRPQRRMGVRGVYSAGRDSA